MATITELIKRNRHTPVRKCYIKRRQASDGSYESTWQRIDNDKAGLSSRVVNWGSVSIDIDHNPGTIGTFEISGLQMIFDNTDGYFNVETDSNSKWFPETTYLNRKYTKLRVDAGFMDSDGSEVGVSTVFEGIVDSIKIGEDGLAYVDCLSYSNILTRYDISDLSLTGNQTVSAVVNAIMNQSKITEYITYTASSPDQNVTIASTENLSGTYWDVLKELAFISQSVILLEGTTWAFKARDVGVSSVFDFKGAGVDQNADINRVTSYDDEGADRVRVFWKDSQSSLSATSADSTLNSKYLGDPQLIDLSRVNTTMDKQSILDAAVDYWEHNRPTIQFETRFMVNEISPLNKITIAIEGTLLPGAFRWGAWNWGDGSKWGRPVGPINISSGVDWMVVRILKDLDRWQMQIKAERVI